VVVVAEVVVAAAVAGVMAAAAAGLEADLVESGAVLAEGVWAKASPAATNKRVSDFRVVVRMFMGGILARPVGERQA